MKYNIVKFYTFYCKYFFNAVTSYEEELLTADCVTCSVVSIAGE